MLMIAMLTIGQTPRRDITDDLRSLLPESVLLQEYGALDGLSRAEAEDRFGYEGKGELLVTRLAGDPEMIRLSADKVFVQLQDCIRKAEADGAQVHLMACTGNFPAYIHQKPILYPGVCQREAALRLGGPVGVLIPNAGQQEQIAGWWAECGASAVQLTTADPFGSLSDVKVAAEHLKEQGARVLCLDCFGYTLEQKAAVEAVTGLPAVLPREVLCQMAEEELSCLN